LTASFLTAELKLPATKGQMNSIRAIQELNKRELENGVWVRLPLGFKVS
jgi:5,10-methylene-tetrahydrofolate dehydrogenase/methenyl tetrahydrofolate cyclohydrolase